jgi:hypothetical protein
MRRRPKIERFGYLRRQIDEAPERGGTESARPAYYLPTLHVPDAVHRPPQRDRPHPQVARP